MGEGKVSRKAILGVLSIALLAVMLASTYRIQPVKAALITVPDNYPTIQQAINNANSWDTIFVKEGIYYEHIVVNKTLSLIAENVSTTIIDGSNAGTVVQVEADNVSIKDFTIRYSGWGWTNNGIYVHFADNVEIRSNYLFTNCHNIRLNYSRGARVVGNVIDGNGYGIRLVNSENCLAADNNVSNCIGGVHLEFAVNCTVKRNLLAQNSQGIRFYSPCTYNKVYENAVYNNTYDGMIDDSMNGNSTFLGNVIFHNNFVSNAYPFICRGSGNAWDYGYPSGGNYWSDYTGTDLFSGPYQNETGSDGIGDSPYVIDSDNKDRYPLMSPYLSPSGPRTWTVDDDGPADFHTIREAISAASNGDTIFVKNGTYSGPIVIDKTLTLQGENRNATIIDGGTNEPSGSIVLVTADNVKISGFTIQHCRAGGNAIWLDGYLNMTFSYNIVTGCNEGVRIFNSSGTVVSDNIVQNCYYNTGVGFDYGFDNTVYRNTIIHNHYGISGGIDCHGNTYSENTIINNDIGFGTTSYDSKFFHNNFVNNGVNVIATGVNQFDDGYPSGGNYWSDWSGIDLCSGLYQNDTGSDGIGDNPYIIDVDNVDRFPLMKPYGGQADIGISQLNLSKEVVGQGSLLMINAKVINYGAEPANFNLTVYVNNTLFGLLNVTLPARNSTICSFGWLTTDYIYGNYTIRVTAEAVQGELDTTDNTRERNMKITIKGDFNGDWKVGPADFALLSSAYGSTPEKSNWNPNCDVNGDESVGPADFAQLSAHYGQHYP